ncbi:MAG: hypothetical protein JNK65_01540 [Deltaproteobacteria bacterium]|nr:hypothetical protein [Deltaproteobacteria bacterium]
MKSSLETISEWKKITSRKKRRYQSLLNGIIGDTLSKHKSALSISMKLLGVSKGSKLCILVHGLCDSEEAWWFSGRPDQSYGEFLKRDCGYSPLYLRYNSGLHISTNGRSFNRLLSQLIQKNPQITEIVLMGHSMGGLVIRSACYYGQKKKAAWTALVKKIFLLGVPHLGSDWEKLGHLTSQILGIIPNPITWGLAALGNMRSAGIKDLRFGYLLDEDWKKADPNRTWKNHRHPVALMSSVQYYSIIASVSKVADNFWTQSWGDGLVAIRSATGKSYFKSHTLEFNADHFMMLRGVSHPRLACHAQVYDKILEWMK